MRVDERVTLSRAEYEALKKQAEVGAGVGELFNAEEMQAIRDQYEERLAAERQRRDDLEWKIRVELAKIHDAELYARHAADQMQRIGQVLQGLIAEGEALRTGGSAPGLPSMAATPPSTRRNTPPPIPAGALGARNGSGSHADAFRQAMARKLVA